MFNLNQQVKFFVPATQEYNYGRVVGPAEEKDKLAVDIATVFDTEPQIVFVPKVTLIPADGETPTIPTNMPKTGPFKMSDYSKKSLL